MSRYTPGPWRITRGAQADAFSIEGPAVTVAHVKTMPNSEANAALIAAAPDLLEAARAALRTLDALGQGVEASEVLRAAVAKAEVVK